MTRITPDYAGLSGTPDNAAPDATFDLDLTDEHGVIPATEQPEDTQYRRETLDMIARLKAEARAYTEDNDTGSYSIAEEWNHNASRFLGNYDGHRMLSDGMQENFRVITSASTGGNYSGLKRATLMRTQNSIMSNVAAAMQTPIRGRIDPVEIGEEDMWYLSPRGGRVVHGLITQGVADHMQAQEEAVNSANEEELGEVANAVVDEKRAFEMVAEEMFAGLTVDQLIGDPEDQGPAEPIDEDQYLALQQYSEALGGPLRSTDFIGMTDKFVAQRMQQIVDILTDEHGMALYWMSNELNSSIFGFGCGSFDWNTTGEDKHTFEFDNVHPMNVFTDPSHIDIKRRSYHLEDRIVGLDEAISKWPEHKDVLKTNATEGKQDNQSAFELGGLSDNVAFQRKMVKITLSWVRHQQVPMKSVDAVEDGLVLEQEDGSFVLAATGEAVEPTEDVRHGTAWPNGPGLRQIVTCERAETVLQDIRCPHWDIPRVWNINIQRPDGGPFGQGEPIRLRHIDDILNRTTTIIVNHLAMLPFPTYFWPADTLRRLKAHGVGIHLRPNVHIPMSRADWLTIVQSGGFSKTRHDAPPIPTDIVNLLDFFLREHDSSSGNTAERQGRTSSAGQSGKSIAELRSASESVLTLKAAYLEAAVQRFYKLLIHAVLNFLPENRWARMLNRYKMPVIREVMRRAQLPEWNITVKVSTGRAQDEQFEQDRALLMHDRGLKSRETTMKDLGDDDVPAELKRILSEQPQEATDAGGVQGSQEAP